MSKPSRLATDWPDAEVASILSAIAKAKDAVPDLGTEKRLSARRGTCAGQPNGAEQVIYAERLWFRLIRDPNFTELQTRAGVLVGSAAWIHLLEAVVMGAVVARHPPEHPDSKTRERAIRHAKNLKTLMSKGIRLKSYADTLLLRKLLDELIVRADRTARKPRQDDRRATREAIDTFLFMMSSTIGSERITRSMVVAYAAMLGDTSTREIEKQLAQVREVFKQRLEAAKRRVRTSSRSPNGAG